MNTQADPRTTEGLTRRDILRAAAAGLVIGTGILAVPKRYFRLPHQAQTFVAKVDDYQLDIAGVLTLGMMELVMSIRFHR